jgi:hypothetical protein
MCSVVLASRLSVQVRDRRRAAAAAALAELDEAVGVRVEGAAPSGELPPPGPPANTVGHRGQPADHGLPRALASAFLLRLIEPVHDACDIPGGAAEPLESRGDGRVGIGCECRVPVHGAVSHHGDRVV